MTTKPIIFAKSKVLRPARAVREHVKLQQHVSVLMMEPDYKDKHVLVAFRRFDLQRLFGEQMSKEFYLFNDGKLSYVGLTGNHETDEEVFGRVVALNMTVVDTIFGDGGFEHVINDLYSKVEAVPVIRMTVLSGMDAFVQNQLMDRLTVIDSSEYETTDVNLKFVDHSYGWEENKDPIPEIVPRKRFHLKDVPLTTRAGRRMVRNSIEQNRETLEGLHQGSHAQLSFDEWMTQAQAVNMVALKDLEKIDALPDDQYIEAMVTFKKAEAQAYHSQAIKDGKTDLHLFDWVKENFGEEFGNLGRQQAEAEVEGIELPQDAGDVELEPAVFLVTFDGTVVENRYPAIGPVSPFATDVLKSLVRNGHKLFIMSMRRLEDREAMLQFLADSDVEIVGVVESMYADGRIEREQVHFITPEDNADFTSVDVDYLIDHRQFGVATVQISAIKDGEPTMYWGDLAQQLAELGYITEEDVEEALSSLVAAE
jgi:hypothetical protein